MLLFSTLLDIDKSLTQDDFVKLVIEWNKGSIHKDNVIPDLEWDGRRSMQYATENLRLDIQEYRNENIIAVRYENRDSASMIWVTNYVMNFNEWKMSVSLDRAYGEEAVEINERFSMPYFITLLIDRGYLKKDGKLHITDKPHYIADNNTDLVAGVVSGQDKYKLPVVYVSKTFTNENLVDVDLLAKKLKGLAHVLVQEDVSTTNSIRAVCESKNAYNGAVGIYYPNHAMETKNIWIPKNKKSLLVKIIQEVLRYSNSKTMKKLYTWDEVSNALLADRLESQRQKRRKAEEEMKRIMGSISSLLSSADEALESMKQDAIKKAEEVLAEDLDAIEAEEKRYQKLIEHLESEVQRLEIENMCMSAKISSRGRLPILGEGEEKDFYPGEIKDLVLSCLERHLKSKEKPDERARIILEDIIKSNDYLGESDRRASIVKGVLDKYTRMDGTTQSTLNEMGYQIDSGDHLMGRYYGDGRYSVTFGSTPSDKSRGGLNVSSRAVKKAF